MSANCSGPRDPSRPAWTIDCSPWVVTSRRPPGRMTRRISGEPVEGGLLREVAPDRNGEDRVEVVVPIGERRALRAALEADMVDVRARPFDRFGNRIAAVPLHVRVRGGKHPHDPGGRASKVECRDPRAELEAGRRQRIGHEVRVVGGPAGRRGPVSHRVHLGTRHRRRESAPPKRRLDSVVCRKGQRQVLAIQRLGGFPERELVWAEAGLHRGDVGGRQPLVEQVGHGRGAGRVRRELTSLEGARVVCRSGATPTSAQPAQHLRNGPGAPSPRR